eukprot:TRINITY_DN80899_c0_g1_i1.p1 TRINITY_DN80899_c0_g1~~TRINITY_DN80899_c0_g1_i1.p1  ORF type:complete len:1469 (+),score=408.18 TRINITY_DN80899_c0_g1_i1:148-4554(+)
MQGPNGDTWGTQFPGGKPVRRVVMHRNVSAAEYEKHKERMEALGLDPNDPAPMSLLDLDHVEEDVDHPPGFVDPSAKVAPQPGLGTSALNASRASASMRQPAIKKVSLQRRTIEEQIQANRNERALDRWEKQQKEWEAFRKVAAAKTGRQKEDLVVTRAEEFRERLEVMELLDRATPDEIKSGGSSWYHSLRGDGTRFVQIGNMFSGLFLPIKLHKENYEHEIVRKPLLRELHERRNEDMESGAKYQKTWRDEEFLMQRLRRYGKKMKDLAPGKLDYHETLEPGVLGVEGIKLHTAQLAQQAQFEEQAFLEEQENTEQATALQSILEAVPEDAASAIVLLEGPHIDAKPGKLQFSAQVKGLATQCIRLRNTGTAVVNYEWKQNLPLQGFQESLLPVDPTSRFMCECAKGQILPGREVETLFTFSSSTPGAFTSSWCLHTYPDLINPITSVFMHGSAKEGDLLEERRQSFCSRMHDDQVLHQIEEIIEDVVEAVKLDPPMPKDPKLPHMQEQLFSQRNAEQHLYWSDFAWRRMEDLQKSCDALTQKTTEPAASSTSKPPVAAEGADIAAKPRRGRVPLKKPNPGPPQARPEEMAPYPPAMLAQAQRVPAVPRQGLAEASLPEIELLLQKQGLLADIPRAVRDAQKRPLEKSPVWSAAYEAVVELVMSVPRFADHSRKFAQLEPLKFICPPAEGSSAEEDAKFSEAIEARRALKSQEETQEKEQKASESFLKIFAKNRFNPVLDRFDEMAKEATLVAAIHERAARLPTVFDRLLPYAKRQTLENSEMGGCVVVYEADLSFLVPMLLVEGANLEDLRASLPQDVLEQVKTKLQGLTAVLEAGPLAVLVVAHIGTPPPDFEEEPKEDGPAEDATVAAEEAVSPEEGMLKAAQREDAKKLQAVQARMQNLLSLAPLLDTVKEVAEPAGASSVEFVSHEAWLGGDATSQDFASKVRNEDTENKVFILENLSALPEELGMFRTIPPPPPVEEPPPPDPVPDTKKKGKAPPPPPPEEEKAPVVQEPPDPKLFPLTWAKREYWANRVLKYLSPEFLVLDSFAASFNDFTLHTGFWPLAPTRIIGPSIEAEMAALMEAIPALGPSTGGDDDEEAEAGEETEAAGPAPLLIAVGGGGFSRQPEAGEKMLLQKLQLLIGMAQLSKIEKDGVVLALGGELAVCVLAALFSLSLGTMAYRPSVAMAAAIRQTFLEVLGRLGVPVVVPVDLACEEIGVNEAAASPPAEGEQAAAARPTYSLIPSLRAAASQRVHLGYIDEREISIAVDPERGLLRAWDDSMPEVVEPLAVEPTEDESPVADPKSPVPAGWQAKDIGDASVEQLCLKLRRCRGIIWNGAFGVREEEKWQQGTRAMLGFVERRLNGGDEDEEEDDEDETEEEDEDDDGAEKPPQLVKEKPEPDADFEVAICFGTHSSEQLPTLVEAPGNFAFVSSSGDALLQMLRGEPLPGLLACEKSEAVIGSG